MAPGGGISCRSGRAPLRPTILTTRQRKVHPEARSAASPGTTFTSTRRVIVTTSSIRTFKPFSIASWAARLSILRPRQSSILSLMTHASWGWWKLRIRYGRMPLQSWSAAKKTIPGTGFAYDRWLAALTNEPTADGAKLSKLIVDAYRDRYTSEKYNDPKTTLSAVDVNKAEVVAKALSQFGDSLSSLMPDQAAKIRSLRESCKEFGADSDAASLFHHVDVGCIASNAANGSLNSSKVKSSAVLVISSINNAVLANYVGAEREDFGGSGLSIYFADSQSAYNKDLFALKGYDKNNKNRPVDFVKDERWADFLQQILSNVQN